MSNHQFNLDEIKASDNLIEEGQAEATDQMAKLLSNEIDPVGQLQYEPIDRHYRIVQIILTALGYLGLAILALPLLLIEDSIWFVLAEGVILLAMIVNLIIVQKAWRFKGYALREYDINYRSGIIFPTITTIPFNRMQQVSLKQNPISKYLHLYSVELVNGAQAMSSLTIPGLTEQRANQIKSTVIDKLRYEQD